MKCPYCFREIPFSTVCPACGRALHFGGNTQFLAEVQQGRLGVKDIFAQTLKRHKKGDAFRSLTRRPALTAEMLETWQRPWMFLRLFVMLLIATVLLTFAAETMVYISPKLKMEFNFPLSVIANIVGSTVIPWTMVLFIWEMDMYGNLSIFDLLGLLLVGGLVSIAIAAPFFRLMEYVFSLGEEYSKSWAAVAEEPAKILICILFILLSRRRLNALDGLVIGAAVASGYAFICQSLGCSCVCYQNAGCEFRIRIQLQSVFDDVLVCSISGCTTADHESTVWNSFMVFVQFFL